MCVFLLLVLRPFFWRRAEGGWVYYYSESHLSFQFCFASFSPFLPSFPFSLPFLLQQELFLPKGFSPPTMNTSAAAAVAMRVGARKGGGRERKGWGKRGNGKERRKIAEKDEEEDRATVLSRREGRGRRKKEKKARSSLWVFFHPRHVGREEGKKPKREICAQKASCGENQIPYPLSSLGRELMMTKCTY